MNDDDAVVHEHDDDDHDAYHKYHGYDYHDGRTVVRHAR